MSKRAIDKKADRPEKLTHPKVNQPLSHLLFLIFRRKGLHKTV